MSELRPSCHFCGCAWAGANGWKPWLVMCDDCRAGKAELNKPGASWRRPRREWERLGTGR